MNRWKRKGTRLESLLVTGYIVTLHETSMCLCVAVGVLV